MLISQRCQYALRAVFELARRSGRGSAKIDQIAAAQAIPPRFLAAILNQLKQGGFVASRRGSDGGYTLTRPPSALTVGELIRFIEGPIGPVGCIDAEPAGRCPLAGSCVFRSLWDEARQAMENVYDATTFEDLIERESAVARSREPWVPMYMI
jgi:Rrf2 family transcriptional regulator, cysteine metabolism repressor